jgi:hypothetical protein
VILSRQGMIDYWASEPERDYREGHIHWNDVPFPEPPFSAAERAILRTILARHPEHL